MGDLSFGEIFVIFLAVLILFGPKKIPEIARELGQGIRKMRGAAEEIKQEIMKETDNDPVTEIENEIKKASEIQESKVKNQEQPTNDQNDRNNSGR